MRSYSSQHSPRTPSLSSTCRRCSTILLCFKHSVVRSRRAFMLSRQIRNLLELTNPRQTTSTSLLDRPPVSVEYQDRPSFHPCRTRSLYCNRCLPIPTPTRPLLPLGRNNRPDLPDSLHSTSTQSIPSRSVLRNNDQTGPSVRTLHSEITSSHPNHPSEPFARCHP